MSQVMKALQRSEKESLGYAPASPTGSYVSTPAKKRNTTSLVVALILIPSLAVLVSQVYLQSEVIKPDEPAVELAPVVSVATTPVSIIRPAPLFSDLKVLARGNIQLVANLPAKTEPVIAMEKEAKRIGSSPESQEIVLTPVTRSSENNAELENLDMSEFSPELALTIESILSGSNQVSSSEQEVNDTNSSTLDIEKDSAQLEGWLPKLNFQTHMYSSDETKRWIKVNNQEASQGEWLKEEVQVVDIEPQFVIIQFKRLNIKVPALYEWQG